MDNRSNGDKLKDLYQKAASTSLLLNLSVEELSSLLGLKKPETPTKPQPYQLPLW